MTAAGITAMNGFTQANPMANGAGNSGTAATVSANDFLLLLVTEMKNQDPTAQTDPNQYINQLVQVNSLEQLIEINENLSAALGPGATAEHSPQRATTHAPGTMVGATDTGSGERKAIDAVSPIPLPENPVSTFAGNLGAGRSVPASQRIAQALSGRG